VLLKVHFATTDTTFVDAYSHRTYFYSFPVNLLLHPLIDYQIYEQKLSARVRYNIRLVSIDILIRP
jgi:hypothetical protein